MSVLKRIQPKIYQLTDGLFANWMPPDDVEVGDYGSIAKERFLREGSLKKLGLDFDIEVTTKADGKMEYLDGANMKIGAALNIKTKESDAIAGAAKSNISIDFSGEGAFVYHLSGINQHRFGNSQEFFGELGKRLASREIQLEDDFVVIDEIRAADTATIIVSEDKEGSLDLSANFQPTGEAFLAKGGGGITVARNSGNFFRWLAEGATIPLLRPVRPVFGCGPNGPNTPLLSKFLEFLGRLIGGRRLEIRDIDLTKYIQNDEKYLAQFAIKSTGSVFSIEFRPLSVQEFLTFEDGFGTPEGFMQEKTEVIGVQQKKTASG